MRPLREALASFHRAPLLGALSIGTIGLSLLIMGLFALSAHNIGSAISDIERRVEVVGYLVDDVGEDRVAIAREEMLSYPEVEDVRYVSKTEALVNARRDLVEFSDVYQGLDINPLPASIHLRLKPGFRDPDAVQEVAHRLSGYDFVEEVRFGEAWVEQLFSLRKMAGVAAAVLGGAFAIVAVLLIGSSVRMTILARAEEIAVMQTLGATEGYIQRPFLVEGFITGLLGGLVALGLTRAGFWLFTRQFAGFGRLSWLPDVWIIIGLVAASILGLLAASFSVRRELGKAYAI